MWIQADGAKTVCLLPDSTQVTLADGATLPEGKHTPVLDMIITLIESALDVNIMKI